MKSYKGEKENTARAEIMVRAGQSPTLHQEASTSSQTHRQSELQPSPSVQRPWTVLPEGGEAPKRVRMQNIDAYSTEVMIPCSYNTWLRQQVLQPVVKAAQIHPKPISFSLSSTSHMCRTDIRQKARVPVATQGLQKSGAMEDQVERGDQSICQDRKEMRTYFKKCIVERLNFEKDIVINNQKN